MLEEKFFWEYLFCSDTTKILFSCSKTGMKENFFSSSEKLNLQRPSWRCRHKNQKLLHKNLFSYWLLIPDTLLCRLWQKHFHKQKSAWCQPSALLLALKQYLRFQLLVPLPHLEHKCVSQFCNKETVKRAKQGVTCIIR